MKQFTFSLDPETVTQLKTLAAKEGLAMSAWMRMFIRKEYREQQEHQVP